MTAVVVGGGVGGLVAARDLATRGEAVVLLEAAERLGGMVTSVEVAGIPVDAGAEAYSTRTDDVRRLCEELGLAVEPAAGRPHIFWPDPPALWPVAQGLLGIPASLDDDAVTRALTPAELVAGRERSAAPLPVATSPSVADLVIAHLGEAVCAKLVAPLTTGVHGLAPQRMPVAQFAPGLLGAVESEGSLPAAVARLTAGRTSLEQPVGGMSRLVGALASELVRLGVEVRLSSRVAGLARDGDGWSVHTIGGAIRADRVVLAVPARVATRLVAPLGLRLTAPRTSVARNVLLALRHPGLDAAPVGSGVLLGRPSPGLRAKALTHYTAKWPWATRDGIHIVRLAWPADDEPDAGRALADAAVLLGLPLTAEHLVDHTVVTWSEMPRALDVAGRTELAGRLEEFDGLSVTGAWVAGNGLGTVVADARRAAA